MAAVDDDNQSQNKDDKFFNSKRKQFSTMQQDFENKLLRTGATYESQVGTILSGWDHLTGASSIAQLPFAGFLYSWTLKLVLQGEWPKLEKIVKTRLGATLQRCSRYPLLEPMCKKLLPLVTDPWGHHTLKEIISGAEVPLDEVRSYIHHESWEIISVRIDTMLGSRCEELALLLLKACMRCISLFSPTSDQHTHFVDLFFVLLYKFHRKQFFENVKELNVEDGVNLVRRLVAQQEKAKVWKHRLKVAEVTIQIVLASCAVKPYNDLFRLVFSEWCSLMKTLDTATDDIISMTRKYIQLAESSSHIYSMASLLHHEFGDPHAALVTELLIGALTRDMNTSERLKANNDCTDSKNQQVEIEHQMATGFMYLSSVFANYEIVARECVLTAFSLHPTVERLGIIKRFVGKNTPQSSSTSSVHIKTEPNPSFISTSPNGNMHNKDTFMLKTSIKVEDNVCTYSNSMDNNTTYMQSSECDEYKVNMPGSFSQNDDVAECRVKEEVDSMDGFLANTQGLIDQLNNKNETQSPVVKCDMFSSSQDLCADDLGISSELCDDLAVVLSSPRWQVLSWLLDRNILLTICDQYLKDSARAKNITTELKYLNLDYTQFKHMPSSEEEFGGIEKGYEHYVQISSDESDVCYSQEKRGFSSSSEVEIPKLKKKCDRKLAKCIRSRKKALKSDSDSTANYLSRYVTTTTTTTSFSESEDTDLEYTNNKGMVMQKGFEGKRVTAVSSNERRKRLRIDAATGRVRPSRKSLVNDLRLYRHMFQNTKSKNTQNNYAPSLGKINLSPNVVITENDQQKIKVEDANHNRISEGDREIIPPQFSPDKDPHSPTYTESFTETETTLPSGSSQHNSDILNGLIQQNSSQSYLPNSKSSFTSIMSTAKKSVMPSTKFQDSYAQFILKNQFRLSQSRKGKGSVKMYQRESSNKPTMVNQRGLSVAQKSILNRIMEPVPNQPIATPLSNTIAMPVSHNPPNLPPNKGPPAGLSRSLPKGTTVVRGPRSDGAGPSGLNNGGTTVNVISRSSHAGVPLSRQTLSITPNFSTSSESSSSISVSRATSIVRSQANASSIDTNVNFQNEVNSLPPLAPATVAVAITPTSQSCNVVTTSPGEIPSGYTIRSSELASSVSFHSTPITSSTVASSLGEQRSTSMLESLLRDQSGSHIHNFSPINRVSPSGCATSFCESVLASAVCTAVTSNLATEVYASTSGMNTTMLMASAGEETAEGSGASRTGFAIENPPTSNVFASASTSRNIPAVSHVVPTANDSANASNILATSTTVTSASPGCLSQYILPAQLIQVQVSDGSTSLGLVPSAPLDFRLPPGTRVIKPNSTMASTGALSISHSSTRPSNILHNVKLVPNRPVVRTVVVPHSVALQSLGNHQTAQIVALNQSTVTSDNESPQQQQHATKIQSTQLQKLLGHNIVPGSLVIRAVRPSAVVTEVTDATGSSVNSAEVTVKAENQNNAKQQTTDSLADRLRGQCLKTTLLASSATQNVGTQTQTTAVKPTTGQIVSQGLMNSSHHSPVGITSIPVVSHVEASPSQPSSSGLNPLNLTSNAVSSEALKQLREFESVFEKVSNKSGKENDAECCTEPFPATISSEESMIAAQLLNMANEQPPAVAASEANFSSPASSQQAEEVAVTGTTTATASLPVTAAVTAIPENTFITSQAGTLILVNPAVTPGPTIATLAGAVQPPPVASPALSSTSSQSSVASSPSSTSSSKGKRQATVITPSSGLPVSKPKSPPPPKIPQKPAITKPQVEESDEIKAKIQSILDQYKQDLANNPQPQPAPRNRKNCPPPKSEGKSSGKKKSQMKKPDGTSTSSPGSIESHLPSVSSSPANLSASTAGEDSDSSMGGQSTTPNRFSQEDKTKTEEPSSPQVLQGVVLSNVKIDGNTTLASFPSAISGGRVFQLIRHGSGKVTAITTQQPYNKSKIALNQGGPPPNVTIQGRINVSDLMESHLASLITGGTGAVTAGNSIITKLVQAQNSTGIQQLILQDSSQQNEQLVQQVAIQPVVQLRPKAPTQSETVPNVAMVTDTSPKLVKHVVQPSHPCLSMGVASASEMRPTKMASPPSQTSIPSPFAIDDNDSSNDSEQSQDGTPSRPLPPFFTLTKQFMTPGQSKFRDRNTSTSGSQKLPSSNAKSVPLKMTTDPSNKPLLQAGFANVKGSVDSLQDASPSSLENSPSILALKSTHCSYELRSNNSMDSIKSSLSTEEEQIPPSPATLTKQLQTAYMSESALSPVISHSQLSGSSSYPSPVAGSELQYSDSQKDVHSSGSMAINRRYSIAGSSRSTNGGSSNLSGSSNALEPSALVCLSSPSGDVYLDQASVGISLDNLALGESHSQSPSLSDLVPPVPLLSWSPRSADSMMGGNSPSLNDALSTNMALENQNSEDSLCDSSTTFPALFSIEGDGASVSSSTSEEFNMPGDNTSSSSLSLLGTTHHYHSSLLSSHRHDFSREQDQTVSSTRVEGNSSSGGEICCISGSTADPYMMSSDSKDDASTESSESEWKFKCKNKYDRKTSQHRLLTNEGASTSCGQPKRQQTVIATDDNRCRPQQMKNRRRSLRQMDVTQMEKSRDSAYNGFDKDKSALNSNDDSPFFNSKPPKFRKLPQPSSVGGEEQVETVDEDAKLFKAEVKEESVSQRVTRGSKRRNEGEHDDKKGKFPKGKKEIPKQEDNDRSDYESHTQRITRSRHISGISDTSSNYSIDRVSTPGPLDSPMGSTNGGGPRNKKRGGSRDSSISSRDGSPLTILQNSYQDYGSPNVTLSTRRASSREQSKKTRCACCVDQQPGQTGSGHSSSNRRSVGKSRGTGHSS